jgi:hypothetical protein
MPIWWAARLDEICWVKANGECLGIWAFRQLTGLIRLTTEVLRLILIGTSDPDEVSRTLKTSSPILFVNTTRL